MPILDLSPVTSHDRPLVHHHWSTFEAHLVGSLGWKNPVRTKIKRLDVERLGVAISFWKHTCQCILHLPNWIFHFCEILGFQPGVVMPQLRDETLPSTSVEFHPDPCGSKVVIFLSNGDLFLGIDKSLWSSWPSTSATKQLKRLVLLFFWSFSDNQLVSECLTKMLSNGLGL